MKIFEAGKSYIHPTYGELIFIRVYNYKGVKWQFKTADGRKLSLDVFETAKI